MTPKETVIALLPLNGGPAVVDLSVAGWPAAPMIVPEKYELVICVSPGGQHMIVKFREVTHAP